MADTPTLEDYENAKLDLNSIGDMSNGAANLNGTGLVTTRTGQTYRTMKKIEADAQTSVDTLLSDTEADLAAITEAAQDDRDAIATLKTNANTDREDIATLKTDSNTDRVAIGTLLTQATADASATNAKKVEAEGYAASAAAAVAALQLAYYGSAQFPEENGESPDKQNQGFFTLPNSKTALTGSGANAFWYGDSSIMLLYDCPVEYANGLNRVFQLAGTDPALSSRAWILSYTCKGHSSNPTTHKIGFGVRGESGASAAWNVDTGSLVPLTVRRMAILVVRSGDNMTPYVLDIDTGTWYDGATVAKPAGFVGVPTITNEIGIGVSGVRSGYPTDWTATSGVFTPQATPHTKGAMRDLLVADKAMTKADVEAIVYSGVNPVTQVTSALTRLHAPLVSGGVISLAVTSNKAALTNGLTQYGPIYAGPTMRRQGATYFVLNALPYPGFIVREQGANVARCRFYGKMSGLTGKLQVRAVDRTGRILRDWTNVDYTLSGTDISFAISIPCPCPNRFEVQARFTDDTTIIAKTHSNLQAGPKVNFWSQSEGQISTLGPYSATGQPTTLNVQPEGDTSMINFIPPGITAPIIKFGRARPGLMSDTMINIANYVRRRTQEPILFGCHTISGTSLRDLMDDTSTSTGRQWADEINCDTFPINRGPNGEYPVTGHVKIGWEAADNVGNYSEVVNVPWYQGRTWNGATLASVGLNSIDHFLYDGSMSMSAVSVELPCNRIVSVNTNTSDFSNEGDQRDSQRNWGHRLGYRIGPPQCTHKMEGENAAGGIGGAWTHPEGNDWEGALEMSYANAEAAMIAIGLGTYQGPVFFESIRVGSAANKVVVSLGNPRPFPGEGLSDPNVGYTTDPVVANVVQATSVTTGVTVHGDSGTITTVAQTIAAGAEADFVVTNNRVRAGDVVAVEIASTTSAGTFAAVVAAQAAGSFTVRLTNLHASNAGTAAIVLRYRILRNDAQTGFNRALAPSGVKLRTKKTGGNPKWGFEAKINNAGSFSLNNVTAATIINAREVEITLSANYVIGETQIAYQPGSPGNYDSATVTQEQWRSGQLFFSGPYFAANQEPGWAVSGSNQPLTLT